MQPPVQPSPPAPDPTAPSGLTLSQAVAAIKGKVDAVFSGHLHRYERRIVDGTLNITAGNGGEGPGNPEFTLKTAEAVYSTMDIGFARVQVTATAITIQMIDEAGRVRDSVTVPRSAPST